MIDSFSLCGNVYTANTGHTDVIYTPEYTYDTALSGTTFTNSDISENAATQAVGVYSPNILPLLPQLKAPHVPAGFISGLTLSNAGTQEVNIAPGEATDTAHRLVSTMLELPVLSVTDGWVFHR